MILIIREKATPEQLREMLRLTKKLVRRCIIEL